MISQVLTSIYLINMYIYITATKHKDDSNTNATFHCSSLHITMLPSCPYAVLTSGVDVGKYQYNKFFSVMTAIWLQQQYARTSESTCRHQYQITCKQLTNNVIPA